MQILLTGGTGFVGAAVRRELLARGHRVRVLARPGRRRELEPGAELHLADMESPGALTEAARGNDAVIHLVGIISEAGSQTFEKVHADLTHRMVEASRAAGVRRFIHMSALNTRPDAPSRYHRTKWAAEEYVRGSGLDWTIFRPSLIESPHGGFAELFRRMSRWLPAVPVIGNGQSLVQPIRLEKVAKAFAGALEEPASIGRTFDLCGPERLTFEELVRRILDGTGRRRAIVHIPRPIAMAQAVVLERVFPMVGMAPPLNRDQILMLEEDNVGDGEPANRLFGLE